MGRQQVTVWVLRWARPALPIHQRQGSPVQPALVASEAIHVE